MSSSSAPFGLLDALKSSLLQPWLRVKDHGVLSISIILGLIVFYAVRYISSPFRKLPPGPRGYPIIGNISEMKTGQWLKFAEWHKKYGQFDVFKKCSFGPFLMQSRPGDVIYLHAVGQSIIVLNSQKAAVELLDRRAVIYSDRPRNVIACDIMTGGLMLGFAPYGET